MKTDRHFVFKPCGLTFILISFPNMESSAQFFHNDYVLAYWPVNRPLVLQHFFFLAGKLVIGGERVNY